MNLASIEIEKKFLDYWRTTPELTDPLEQERQKIAARGAFFAAYVAALKYLTGV